jgi:hypothetical protein
VSAIVKKDDPIPAQDGVLRDEIRDQRVHDVGVIDVVPIGFGENVWPKAVKELAAASAQTTTDLVVDGWQMAPHHVLSGGLLRSEEGVPALDHCPPVALFPLALLVPFSGDLPDHFVQIADYTRQR